MSEKKENGEKQAEVLKVFDEYDEDQIVEESRGRIVDTYFYRFSEQGREVTGISYAGVRYVAAEMAKRGAVLEVTHSEVIESPESFRGKSVVRNSATGLTLTGVSEVKKKYKSGGDNAFAYVQAYNKAERNGLRKHEPEKVILTAYEEWKDTKMVRNITPQNSKLGPFGETEKK